MSLSRLDMLHLFVCSQLDRTVGLIETICAVTWDVGSGSVKAGVWETGVWFRVFSVSGFLLVVVFKEM